MSAHFTLAFAGKLRRMDPTSQASIQAMSTYVQLNKASADAIGGTILREVPGMPEAAQLAVVYLVNELWQTSQQKHGDLFVCALAVPLQRVFAAVALNRKSAILPKLQRVLGIWGERATVNRDILAALRAALADPLAALENMGESLDCILGPELSAADAAAAAAAAAASSENGGDAVHTTQPCSALAVLEREVALSADEGVILPTATLLMSSAQSDSVGGTPYVTLLARVEALAAETDRAEVASGLTRPDASAARGLMQRAFLAEARAAETGLPLDEVVAASLPVDSAAQGARVAAHVSNMEAEERTRQRLLEAMGDLLGLLPEEGKEEEEAEHEEGLIDPAKGNLANAYRTPAAAVVEARRVLAAVRGVKRLLLGMAEEAEAEVARRAEAARVTAQKAAEEKAASDIARALLESAGAAAARGSGPMLAQPPQASGGYYYGQTQGQQVQGQQVQGQRALPSALYGPPSDDFGAIFAPGAVRNRAGQVTAFGAPGEAARPMQYAGAGQYMGRGGGGPLLGAPGGMAPMQQQGMAPMQQMGPYATQQFGAPPPGAPPSAGAGRGSGRTLPAWMTSGLQ
jgi:hypothetical protein